ncbi:MAG: hypothetical protein R6U59_02920, partial [Eubacteriales bacterium]
MKKIILIVLSIFLITIPAWGNAAAPSQDPETNMLYFSDDTGISLVEEWITFTIDEDEETIEIVGLEFSRTHHHRIHLHG